MPKSSGFLAVFLACLLCFTPSLAHAKGVNSAKDAHLPMGAGNQTFLYLTSTGRVHFGADVDGPLAWIDTKTGEAQFGGGVEFGNGATVKGFVDAIDGQNIGLKTALPIWANGFLVGPRAYFGRHDATSIGLWYLNENRTLDAGKSLVVKNNGWVGIGTVNPSSLLSVAGNAYASDGAEANTLSVRDAEQEGSIDAARMDILTRLSALKCSEGQLLTKDTDKTFKCVTVAFNGTFNCPAGEALTGFVNGVPQCAKMVEPIGCRPVVDCVGREPEPGDMCQDGTVFVGYTPDGHVKMFAMPCLGGGGGMYGWDGCSKCRYNDYFWWAPTDYSYASGHYSGSIGVQDKVTGKANTSAIVAFNKEPAIGKWGTDYDSCAAAYCDEVVAYGHSDWYLPAAAEVLLFGHKKVSFWDLYSERWGKDDIIPKNITAWTSTEHPSSANRALLYYYYIDAGYVAVKGQGKGREFARCVRKEGCRKKIDCNAVEPSIGDMCLDGTVYVGLSPDGNVKMFTTPCDLGQTWDGCSTCVGTRTKLYWSPWVTYTGINNPNTGKANSAALAAIFPSHNTAARACENLVANGHSDWYLPAINEIFLLGNESMSIGNFSHSWGSSDASETNYWSSSESTNPNYNYTLLRASSINPSLDHFSDLYQDPAVYKYDLSKTDIYVFRCVRR